MTFLQDPLVEWVLTISCFFILLFCQGHTITDSKGALAKGALAKGALTKGALALLRGHSLRGHLLRVHMLRVHTLRDTR